jgi:hypothetical protein
VPPVCLVIEAVRPCSPGGCHSLGRERTRGDCRALNSAGYGCWRG